MKPTDQQWALAMLTTAANHDPAIFELAYEATPDGACFLADLAVGWLRALVAQSHRCCVHCLLAEMGLGIAREAG
jgi:hypothetical protein